MPSLRLLIADDDPIIRLDLRQMLEGLNYEVIAEVGDGREAVESARELKPDLCILDVKMPNMDGIEAATVLTEEGIAPAILLTAYNDPELVLRAADAGVFGYLVKPFKGSDLPSAIEVARARFEQNLALSREVQDLREKLEVRKLVDRAKGLLMATQGLSEPDAYRHIQTESMNNRISIRQVAEAVIRENSVQS